VEQLDATLGVSSSDDSRWISEQSIVTERTRGLIIAIDGPSGAGKSTVAKRVAKQLGYLYIDTGAMYRAVGLKALRSQVPLNDTKQIIALAQRAGIELKGSVENYRVFLDGEEVTREIRDEAVSQAASIVSALSEVRRILVKAQQKAQWLWKGEILERRYSQMRISRYFSTHLKTLALKDVFVKTNSAEFN
jgi:cytidylate kinase